MSSSIEVRVFKSMHGGWAAESLVALSKPKYFLKVLTMKRSDGRLNTTAMVVEVDEHFTTQTWNTYSKCVISTNTRATKPGVEAQHRKALEELPPFVKEAECSKSLLEISAPSSPQT